MNKMGRPAIYNRKKQTTIRFYVDDEVKHRLKVWAIKNKMTLQEIFETNAEELLGKLENEGNE